MTFSPDLSKFGMEELEADTVALMRKRVYDMAGILGKGVKVRRFSLMPRSTLWASATATCTAFAHVTGLYIAVQRPLDTRPHARSATSLTHGAASTSVAVKLGQLATIRMDLTALPFLVMHKPKCRDWACRWYSTGRRCRSSRFRSTASCTWATS